MRWGDLNCDAATGGDSEAGRKEQVGRRNQEGVRGRQLRESNEIYVYIDIHREREQPN